MHITLYRQLGGTCEQATALLAALQVLPIEGQNDGSVTDLLITEDEFHAWVGRHRAALLAAEAAGQGGEQAAPIQLVAEDNSAMRGSYAMLDAYCRRGPCWHALGRAAPLEPG